MWIDVELAVESAGIPVMDAACIFFWVGQGYTSEMKICTFLFTF